MNNENLKMKNYFLLFSVSTEDTSKVINSLQSK